MTPEKEKALSEHISAIAKILYEDTPPSEWERRKNVASTKSSPRKGLTPMGGEQLFPLLTQRMATEDFEKRFFNHPVH